MVIQFYNRSFKFSLNSVNNWLGSDWLNDIYGLRPGSKNNKIYITKQEGCQLQPRFTCNYKMEYSDRAEWRSSLVRDITCLPNLDPELFCACRCAHSKTRKHWGRECFLPTATRARSTRAKWNSSEAILRPSSTICETHICEYSQLSPRRTPLGPALSVRLREVSVLLRVK